MAAAKPFHAYSSFNRKDGRTDPLVSRRRNRALSMWSEMATLEEIAEELRVEVQTVRRYIRWARRRDNALAFRPLGWDTKRKMRKALRQRNIKALSECGMSPKEIASRLQVTVRLVQIRLKERG